MKNLYYILCMVTMAMFACSKSNLNIQPASEYSDDFLKTASGIDAVLNSAYDNMQYNADPGVNRIYLEECGTDIFVNFRGFLNGQLTPYQNFTNNPSSEIITGDLWQKCYRAIRDANIILDAAPANTELSEDNKTNIVAQTTFIRGLAYRILYGFFGPVPIINKVYKSSKEEFTLPRATDADMFSFIETDLKNAADALPLTQSLYGKATKGAALGTLMELYMIKHQWAEAASAAQRIIDLNQYTLMTDFSRIFALDNEGNKEIIFAFPSVNIDGNGNVWVANALPPQYPTNIFNTATQVCTPVAFYNSFSANDDRRKLFLTSYTNTQGQPEDLLTGNEYQNPRSLKYPIDTKADSRSGGQDFIYLRYAEVLLARAEALVMNTGAVSQESIDLLNQVRTRAKLPAYTAADLPDQNSFIKAILQERAWEFYSEGKRREDLLRHDLYISNAIARGKNAKPFHVLMPIPQSEIDANPNLSQNEGY
ncbi:MAG: RagB/SusD family nutrient uptake outer membrane protein [Flavihumibacter sp.]